MTKRMTAEEVAEWASCKASIWQDVNLIDAAQLVRDNLVPQWQDEPDGAVLTLSGMSFIVSIYLTCLYAAIISIY